MSIKRAVLLFLLSMTLLQVMLFPVRSVAKIYKWVDEKGVVHFTDDLEEVPLKYRPDILSTKPGLKKPEIPSIHRDWNSMTHEEKVEYLRRLKEKKAEDDRKIAGYPEPIQQLIRNHKLQVGMTKEMVLLSWGDPIHIRPQGPKQAKEQWTYFTSRPDKNAYAFFENDILTGWEE